MLHQCEVVVTAAQRDHELTPGGHLHRSEDPHSGTCRCDQSVLLLDRRMRGKSMSRACSMTLGTGEPWHTGGDCPSSRGTDWPQTMAGQPGELAGRLAILVDGTPAPPVTSFATSKSFSRYVVATKAHDMTLVGGASLNSGIFLAAAVVDGALKGSMAGRG
jgi:hypothetical protein